LLPAAAVSVVVVVVLAAPAEPELLLAPAPLLMLLLPDFESFFISSAAYEDTEIEIIPASTAIVSFFTCHPLMFLA
jgi:hypothetical protein